MQPIRLLHTADIHIGMENYGRVDPTTGINGRVMDFLRRLSDIGEYAIEHDIDVFVFAGDAYRTRDPNPTYQREFARRIKHIADAGIPVVLLVGNHDLPAVAKRATSVEIFGVLDVPNVYVGDREKCVDVVCRRGQHLQVAMAPYPLRAALINREEHRGKSLEELDQILQDAMVENLGALATEASKRPEIPAILVGHFSTHGATLGSEQKIMIGRDAHVPPHILKNPAWRYVALGHIHRHQNLNPGNNPPVVYSGSIERIDFGEEGETKGFVVAEIDETETRWQFIAAHKRPARPFVTIKCDVCARPDPTPAVLEAIARAGDLSEAIVRVVIRIRQEQETMLIDREIAHALEQAYFVAAVQKDVQRTTRDRLGGVSIEELTPLQVLQQYLHVKETPDERAALLVKQGAALIEDVDGRSA
jgi:DNA repair protein SbcD/Mre11